MYCVLLLKRAGAGDPFQTINPQSLELSSWSRERKWIGMFLMECFSIIFYLACEASSKSSVSCVSVRALPRVSQSLPENIKIRKILRTNWCKYLLPAGWLYRRPEKGSSVLRVTVMESALHSRLTETRRTLWRNHKLSRTFIIFWTLFIKRINMLYWNLHSVAGKSIHWLPCNIHV